MPDSSVGFRVNVDRMSDIGSTMLGVETVTKRDLNQHTASVLDRVTDTGDIIITERGEPRWQLSTYRGQTAPLVRLERDGRYTPPASTPTPWPSDPGGPVYTDTDIAALLDEMRGDH